MNNMDLQLQQLRNNPQQFVKQAGWDIPQELMGNPQAMVMHLIQTGQVGGPVMRMIAPILGRMGIKL